MFLFLSDGEKFYALSDFEQHLKEKHTNGKYTCYLCSVTLPVAMATQHLRVHAIGSFACIYCYFGTNSEQVISNHLSNKHSTKLLYAAGREPRKDVEVSFFCCPIFIQVVRTVRPELRTERNLDTKMIKSRDWNRTFFFIASDTDLLL